MSLLGVSLVREIRDLTGDVLFPVTCKRTIPTTISTTIPTVTMTNPEALPVHHVQ